MSHLGQFAIAPLIKHDQDCSRPAGDFSDRPKSLPRYDMATLRPDGLLGPVAFPRVNRLDEQTRHTAVCC